MFPGPQLKLLLVCTQLEHQQVLLSAAAEELRAHEAGLQDILDDQQPKARSELVQDRCKLPKLCTQLTFLLFAGTC